MTELPPIVYQDQAILVVNKPSGLLSVPGRLPQHKDSVALRLQQVYPEARIVHRLDWETSGLMVLALSKDYHRALSRQFEQRLVHKQYQAVVAGQIAAQGEANWPLICDWERRPRQKVCYEHGKPAQTLWQRLAYHAETDCALVDLKPITGRSHQLRVHMQQQGHVILGDPLYADPQRQQQASRLLLHAYQLSFYHPEHQAWMQFVQPCELLKFLQY